MVYVSIFKFNWFFLYRLDYLNSFWNLHFRFRIPTSYNTFFEYIMPRMFHREFQKSYYCKDLISHTRCFLNPSFLNKEGIPLAILTRIFYSTLINLVTLKKASSNYSKITQKQHLWGLTKLENFQMTNNLDHFLPKERD